MFCWAANRDPKNEIISCAHKRFYRRAERKEKLVSLSFGKMNTLDHAQIGTSLGPHIRLPEGPLNSLKPAYFSDLVISYRK